MRHADIDTEKPVQKDLGPSATLILETARFVSVSLLVALMGLALMALVAINH